MKRISTKKILITILILALSSILIFSISCSSTEDPVEKNYDGFPPPSGKYREEFSTNEAMVTIYHNDGSCKITGTAHNMLIKTTNQTNMNFEILVGGWRSNGEDPSKWGGATNVKVISPTNIKMLSASAWWYYLEKTGNYELGVYLENNISGEGEVRYAFSGTN